MKRPHGGRHRNPSETRRRMFLAILLIFGLATAATSLWALDPPLAETAVETPDEESPESGESPSDTATLSDARNGDSGIRPQEAEPAPTTEAAEETTTAAEPEPEETAEDDGDQAEASPYADTEAEVLELVNQERSGEGCGDLERNGLLDTAARLHAEDMAVNDYFDHISLDGRDPTDRANEQGYEGGVGENIAAGYPDAAAVMEGWMDSEGHRANILNCDYDVIGIGVADRDGTLYWVQNFG